MKKTILFVDNTEEFLEVHTKLLELRGYKVVRAISVAEAESQLQQHNVHLAILDIRLEDEEDPLDISGLEFAQNETYRYLPKIILTAHQSWKYAEMALGATLHGLQVVNMIAKADGTDKILQAVDKAFADYVPVNWSLVIRASDSRLFPIPRIVTSIAPALKGEQLSLHIEEVQELFSRLFMQHEQISIGQIITQTSERSWIAVSAFDRYKDERQYLVSCGRRPLTTVDQEFAPKNGNFYPVKSWESETAHYAAYAAVLPGVTNLEDVVTLTNLYRYHPIEQVLRILRYLFEVILSSWHQDNRYWEAEKGIAQIHKLWLRNEDFAQTESDMTSCIQSICEQALSLGLARIDCAKQRLTIHLSQEGEIMLPNPVVAVAQKPLEVSDPVLYGTAHGNVDGTAVLTDTQENCWLIDYTHINRGPLLQDFVSLETAIKYDMFVMPDFDERYKMEILLTSNGLAEPITTNDSIKEETADAIQAINLVRKWAATTGISTRHYRIGIVLNALGRLLSYNPDIRYTRRELVPYIHNLVSAAIVYQQLTTPSRPDLPPQAIYSLWIDEETKEVWVEGEIIDLTPQEFDLLYYLYNHAGKPRNRDLILNEVFDLKYEPHWSEKQRRDFSDPRINSAISRLRKKVEPDSDEPRYIISVWGNGYKLELDR